MLQISSIPLNLVKLSCLDKDGREKNESVDDLNIYGIYLHIEKFVNMNKLKVNTYVEK